VTRQTPKDHPERRGHGLEEAQFTAERLEAMLACVRGRA
jgi:hypothetical protein